MINMYEPYCRILLNNGSRFIYTTHRIIWTILEKLKEEYPYSHTELSINEKVAYELALSGSIAGKRNACFFSADKVYEALDPIMSSAYQGVTGGLLIIAIRDSFEEVTPLGLFSKLPLFVVENIDEFAGAVNFGYYLSEKYEIPVIIQITPQELDLTQPTYSIAQTPFSITPSRFFKNPNRWAATPRFRFLLHKELNQKIDKIREEFEIYEGNKKTIKGEKGLITTRPRDLPFHESDVSILTISTVHPLPRKLVNSFIKEVETFYIIEGEYPVIELQIENKEKLLKRPFYKPFFKEKHDETLYGFCVVRDILGPASSINIAHGIKKSNPDKKILALTFEDAFFHSGMPAFINTLYNNSSYVLLIMTERRGKEIEEILKGWGFTNIVYLDNIKEIESLGETEELTVVLYRGMV